MDGHTLQAFLSYEAGSQLVPSFSFQSGYRYGMPVRTVYDYSSGAEGVLELPMKVGPSCQFSAVRFLKDFSSVCPVRLTPEVCRKGKGTKLDYQVL